MNYVFDKREGVGISSTAGVGGVVAGHTKKLKKKNKKKNKNNKKKSRDELELETNVLGRCCTCNVPWERYVGKKKCYTCGVPVLMCDSCMTQKIEKIPTRALEVRCPLCKEENITVPASMTGTKKKKYIYISKPNLFSRYFIFILYCFLFLSEHTF